MCTGARDCYLEPFFLILVLKKFESRFPNRSLDYLQTCYLVIQVQGYFHVSKL